VWAEAGDRLRGDSRSAHLPVRRDDLAGHTHTEMIGAACICDGLPKVLRGAREQLMQGASQVKLMAGGGVASPHDPIDVTLIAKAETSMVVIMKNGTVYENTPGR
jgi:imidazolonepropionase-like amidohydrolase